MEGVQFSSGKNQIFCKNDGKFYVSKEEEGITPSMKKEGSKIGVRTAQLCSNASKSAKSAKKETWRPAFFRHNDEYDCQKKDAFATALLSSATLTAYNKARTKVI